MLLPLIGGARRVVRVGIGRVTPKIVHHAHDVRRQLLAGAAAHLRCDGGVVVVDELNLFELVALVAPLGRGFLRAAGAQRAHVEPGEERPDVDGAVVVHLLGRRTPLAFDALAGFRPARLL
eukprot:465657-Prymnesium_polylepis.1